METTKTRDLADVLGDIEAHKTECAAAHVPANADKLVRLALEAVSHLGEIKAAADLAMATAREALERVGLEPVKPAAKVPAKKAAAKKAKAEGGDAPHGVA